VCHKEINSIFNTSAGIGGKAGALVVIKGGCGFNQADGANGNQVLLVFDVGVIAFDNMGHQP